MGSNSVPQNAGEVIQLATNMIGGLTALEQALAISQVTAVSLQGRLTAFTTANTLFNNAREGREGASAACTAVTKEINRWLLVARSVLVPYLGATWTTTWAAAGFTDNSTAVPRTISGRFKLIGLLATFLKDNPSYEDPDPKVKVTAVEASKLKEQSEKADAAYGLANTAAGEQMKNREAALSDLKDSMRMLIRILDGLLDADDPRWKTFGLNEPASETTPGVPTNLTVAVVDGTALLCQCDGVPTATRYRWRTRVFGEKAYKLATSTTGPLAQVTGFTIGASVDVIVQAVNGSAEGGPSEPVRVSIPAASTLAQPTLAAASIPTTNGLNDSMPKLPISMVQHVPGNGYSTVR